MVDLEQGIWLYLSFDTKQLESTFGRTALHEKVNDNTINIKNVQSSQEYEQL